jgi:hypothetical protein
LRLFGAHARLVWEQVVEKNTEKLQLNYDFSSLAPGNYFWQVQIGKVHVGTTWLKQ